VILLTLKQTPELAQMTCTLEMSLPPELFKRDKITGIHVDISIADI